jgi:hypothetical protein
MNVSQDVLTGEPETVRLPGGGNAVRMAAARSPIRAGGRSGFPLLPRGLPRPGRGARPGR